jgi:hypothetical protein
LVHAESIGHADREYVRVVLGGLGATGRHPRVFGHVRAPYFQSTPELRAVTQNPKGFEQELILSGGSCRRPSMHATVETECAAMLLDERLNFREVPVVALRRELEAEKAISLCYRADEGGRNTEQLPKEVHVVGELDLRGGETIGSVDPLHLASTGTR